MATSFSVNSEATELLFEKIQSARSAIAQVWLGDPFVIDLLLVSVVASGHLLLEDVPGVGKTTLAKALASVMDLSFNRIQFTNDILPADMLGGNIYNPKEGTFSFIPGPIFTDFVLADEINRAPTRSQSAFLQAMEEGQVTVDGVNYSLSELFTVIATQNPVDLDSTHALPEAQLDRFLVSTRLGYPSEEEEVSLLTETRTRVVTMPAAVFSREEIECLRAAIERVFLHEDLARYIVSLSRATRDDPRVRRGISPRGSLHLAQAAKAHALINQRMQVLPDDIKIICQSVWGHRLHTTQGLEMERDQVEEVLNSILASHPIPR